jgi:hypothetical protein
VQKGQFSIRTENFMDPLLTASVSLYTVTFPACTAPHEGRRVVRAQSRPRAPSTACLASHLVEDIEHDFERGHVVDHAAGEVQVLAAQPLEPRAGHVREAEGLGREAVHLTTMRPKGRELCKGLPHYTRVLLPWA